MNTWIEIPKNSDFSIYNLPFGIFSTNKNSKRVGIAIGNNIIENGLSMGLGIKFGNTGNQLDLSYNNGIRSEQNGFNETFKQFSIGISVGDVWFLRRRAKQ